MEVHIQNLKNNPKKVHERGNAQIRMIKMSIIMVQFNSRCLYYILVSMLFGLGTGELDGLP